MIMKASLGNGIHLFVAFVLENVSGLSLCLWDTCAELFKLVRERGPGEKGGAFLFFGLAVWLWPGP